MKDKVVLVTGASSGIGWHLCASLTRQGAQVVALARTARAGGVDAALRVDADVTDEASVRTAIDEVGERFGRIDAVVNNAGVVSEASLNETSPSEWTRILHTNLTGPFVVTRAAYPLLVKARGCVINISSVAGVKTMRGLGAYGASKAGLLHLTRTMALEFARDGIRANAIVPGYIRTPMNEEFLASAAGAQLQLSIPLKEAGSAGDVEEAVVFLVGDGARYITGATLNVDGGFLLK